MAQGRIGGDGFWSLPQPVVAGHDGGQASDNRFGGREMIGVVAVQIGASRRYDGPSGKSDRALFFGLLGFLYALGVNPGIWSSAVLLLIIVLLAVTIINRAKSALREVNSNTPSEAD